ncbi:MAG: tRNA lysidine(34) synthetase TilS [Prochlorococcaceae cyanobacterium]
MILPSDPPGPTARWSRWHLRLHRHLRHQPALLPDGAPLLLAVSGGQDSMALTALLADLRRLHHWPLRLWHGNHGWRAGAAAQAEALASWAAGQGLPLELEEAAQRPTGEAAGRRWRYERLAAVAGRHGCAVVVTGHTASDRAETVLLNLARGSHRRGLASLRERRPLAGPAGPWLARPLLIFERQETAAICRELGLPVWIDPSNDDPRFSRNRVRAEVLPVLEQLHPGAARRLSAMAGRLAAEHDSRLELLELALAPLRRDGDRLARQALLALAAPCRRELLRHWLEQHPGAPPSARALDTLLARLALAGPGRSDLPGGHSLHWNREVIWWTATAPGCRQAGEREGGGQ